MALSLTYFVTSTYVYNETRQLVDLASKVLSLVTAILMLKNNRPGQGKR